MERKFVFSQTCVIFFLLVWSMSKCQDTYQLCPSEFYGGYIDSLCSNACGSTCTFVCKTGFDNNRPSSWLTCGENGEWSPDINSSCLKSGTIVKPTSALTVLRSTDEGNIINIMGITAGSLIGLIIIVTFVAWIAKRGRKSQRRVPGLRSREYQEHDVTNIRQQHNANCISSVSSVEPPSYNGFFVHPFVQRIPTISSSCKYPEPPPSYSETSIAPYESPPTYEEVVTDPSRFILNI
ncbi:hypothetical protein CHS0354_002985 [Potamilus streckersoni]|uniref:Sushi domain-containing protein n=1 Tax=Potamilus streckersoni TaxID=2493646 RepID=A0AAE0RSS6_9BIVA|nr:hypothetical protein CHS0354_002985 [Potamilus streckersoni]